MKNEKTNRTSVDRRTHKIESREIEHKTASCKKLRLVDKHDTTHCSRHTAFHLIALPRPSLCSSALAAHLACVSATPTLSPFSLISLLSLLVPSFFLFYRFLPSLLFFFFFLIIRPPPKSPLFPYPPLSR